MIVKIWPINADYAGDKSKVGGIEGLKNAFDYVTDSEKVVANRNDIPNMDVLDHDDLEQGPEDFEERNRNRVLNYMANEDKIEGKYISGYLCDPDNAIAEFNVARERTLQTLKRNVREEKGAIAFHMVQSFPEGLSISDEEVHQCGLELCEKINAHQAIVCSHVHPIKDDDGEIHGKCKHNHILFNAYIHPDKLDPKRPNVAKYNDCNDTYAQLRAWNDEIAINHGLPIIRNPDDDRVYSWKETDEINKGRSWKQRIRLDIETIRRSSGSWAEFVQQMEDAGYKIKEGKHVTYRAPDGKHSARGATLGRQYTKKNLELYWSYREYAYREVEQEVKNNTSPPLLDTVLGSSSSLSASIPIGMKSQGDSKYYYLPLENVKQSNEVLSTYFNEKELYDICDENKHTIVAATGKEIIACMEKLREGKQKLQEDKEKPTDEKENPQRDSSDQWNKDRYYTYVFFVNSRTKKPYRTSLYDNYGRRRSLLELMLLLAITVLKKEDGLWDPETVPAGKENDPIYAPRNWKIQNMIDSIYTAQEENIETPAQMDQRLKEAGAAYSRATSARKKTMRAKEKMEALNEAVKSYRKTAGIAQQIFEMPEGRDRKIAEFDYRDVLTEYNSAKAVLYQYKVTSEEEIADFERRYEKIQKDIEDLDERVDLAKEEYRRMKKLSYNIELAQNTQYCYGPDYEKEQEQTQENDQKQRKEFGRSGENE